MITAVAPGSIGEELELEPGDVLLSIDGEPVEDIFDYEYKTDSEAFVMTVRKPDGEEWELEIESGGEDLGLTRCLRECGRPCILRTMIPGCRFCRGIM